jgi:hypothetical protein
MMRRSTALLIAWSLCVSSAYCFAQEFEDFPDSTLTVEQWQQRVLEGRHRTEEFVANARTRTADPPPSDEEGAEAVNVLYK